MKNVLVLSATSGIAKAIAYHMASERCNLILAGRNMDQLDDLAKDISIRYNVNTHSKLFDASDSDQHEQFFKECLQLLPLDTVVLCCGFLGDQKEGQSDFNHAKKIIDTNFTSCVSILNIAANYFEVNRHGIICAISSVAGDRGRQSNYLYGSAKGALSLYLQGLRNRLAKSGVHVLTVKPGFVDTKMTYGQPGMFLVAKPEAVAKDIYKAMLKKRNNLYTPFFWKWIMLIIRSIPENIFKNLKL